MSGQPRRPVFSEAQVLAGADLTRVVDHAAEAQARHERTLHTWGITQGLELVGEPDSQPGGPTFIRITLGSGAAVDGTGLQVVVAEPVPLDEGAFEQVNGIAVTQATRDAWFPVLLAGRDQEAPPEGIAPGACGQQAAPTRVVEGYEVSFGRQGDELDLDDQHVPPIDEGPGRGANPWRVLLGFVRWNPDIGQFSEVTKQANGVSVRYAGAMADEVAARDGRVEVRTRVTPALGTPAAVVDEQQGGRLYFGLHDGAGNVKPLLTVTGQGDVTAEGTISGLLTSGSVLLQSGLATDGVRLPLPEGATEEQVTKGQVALHVTVTAHVPPSAAPAGMFAWVPKECRVDADRRVRCVVTWFDATNQEDRPATCDYVVMAAAASEGGP